LKTSNSFLEIIYTSHAGVEPRPSPLRRIPDAIPMPAVALGPDKVSPRGQRDVLEATGPGRHCCSRLRVSNWSYLVSSGTRRVPAGSGGAQPCGPGTGTRWAC